MISATAASAVAILKELAHKIESGELDVGMLHVGPAMGTTDPYSYQPVCQKVEVHTFSVQKKSEC